MTGARFFCGDRACATTIAVPSQEMTEAAVQARKEGWSVRHDGPGHGWVAWCPTHGSSCPVARGRE